ncbi:MAG TPA: hypothetical protein VHC39_09990 [Rhizomicrobium sp.]|nr:hypothetical protein [Rhizomicrobium sp.]
MRGSFSFLTTAALLAALTSAYAANPSDQDAGKMAIHKDDNTAAGPAASASTDDKTNVIILDQKSLQALPNPYANPGPRMISDVWAMRT